MQHEPGIPFLAGKLGLRRPIPRMSTAHAHEEVRSSEVSSEFTKNGSMTVSKENGELSMF